ncbi:GHMP family kinase ATP-binding protein [Poriferisphaera corsica]|nr:galactokinase family protein [Poriferisphaera corsica]
MPCSSKFGATCAENLIASGMSECEAHNKERLFDQCSAWLVDKMGRPIEEAMGFWLPGRLEFLGKHTDYCGGRSMLGAIERGICMVAAARKDHCVRVARIDRGEERTFEIKGEIEPRQGDWMNYLMTAVKRVHQNFGSLHGFDLIIGSDLPMAAGMSSSSAVIVGMWLVMDAANGLKKRSIYREQISDELSLAEYLGCIENGTDFRELEGNRGVGTLGGSQDHTAILLSDAGKLKTFGFSPIRFEQMIEIDKKYAFIIGVSGVDAHKTGAAMADYNKAAMLAKELVEMWNNQTGSHAKTLTEIVRSDSFDMTINNLFIEYSGELDCKELKNRLAHFIRENDQIIPAVMKELKSNHYDVVGDLIDQSQNSAEKLLGNQVMHTIELAKSARNLGAVAASAFGAGFGGSVWALVEKRDRDRLMKAWKKAYKDFDMATSERACFFETLLGPGAMRAI